MPTCVLKNCTTGYKTNFDKYALFRVPKNIERRNQWQSVLGNVILTILTEKHRVCERHFHPTDVIKHVDYKDKDGNFLYRHDLVIPRLSETADPRPELCSSSATVLDVHLTNCTSENLPGTSSYSTSTDRTEAIDVTEEVAGSSNLSRSETQGSSSIVAAATRIEGFQTEMEVETPSVEFSFTEVASSTIKLPVSWQSEILSFKGSQSAVFTKSKLEVIDGQVRRVIFKELIVGPTLQFQVSVLGQVIKSETFNCDTPVVRSIAEIEDLLTTLDAYNVCQGHKTNAEYQSSVTFKDKYDTYRHKKCTFLISIGSLCPFCNNLRRTIQKKLQVLQKQVQQPKKRIRVIDVTSSNAKHLESMKKKHKVVVQKKNRLIKRNQKLKEVIKDTREKLAKVSGNSVKIALENSDIPANQKEVILQIISSSKSSSAKGHRYSDDWIIMCLLLHMRSPKAYVFVRSNGILPLPHVRTVRRYLSKVNSKCGFDPQFFQLLKLSFQEKTGFEKHGLLLVDEMLTRQSVNVHSKSLTYTGLADFGTDTVTDFTHKADHGLVLLFQPLFENYAQPIAVFASKGSVPGVELAKIIVKAIILMEDAGAHIHGVITDGASTNRKFWSEVGVSGKMGTEKCSFAHPVDENRRVFVFSDICHLIKTLRNKFASGELQLQPNGGIAKFEHVATLLEEDSKLPGNARVCPRLTFSHINLNSSAKMRVRLAVQIFSKSVARGLKVYKRYVESLKNTDVDVTIELCEWIDQLFDALNNNSTENGLTGLTENSPSMKILKDSLSRLNKWQKDVDENRIPKSRFLTQQTADGLRITLLSTMEMTSYLIERYNFPYILTGKINQDALERFFGTVRLAGGSNDHPSTPTFLQIYKILSIFSTIKPPTSGNCSVERSQSNTPLISLSQLKQIFSSPSDVTEGLKYVKDRLDSHIGDDDWDIEDVIEHDYARPEIIDCVQYYLTSYFVSKITTHYKCDTCSKAFIDHAYYSPNDILVQIVQMHGAKPAKLKSPNACLQKFLQFLEGIFQRHCKNSNALDLILTEVVESNILSFPCPEHKNDVIPYIVFHYIRFRMRQFCTVTNTNSNKENMLKKKMSKLSKT